VSLKAASRGGFGKSNKKRIETAENSVYIPRKPRLSAAEEQDEQPQASAPEGGSASLFSSAKLNAPGGNWVNVEDNIEEVRLSLYRLGLERRECSSS